MKWQNSKKEREKNKWPIDKKNSNCINSENKKHFNIDYSIAIACHTIDFDCFIIQWIKIFENKLKVKNLFHFDADGTVCYILCFLSKLE